MQLSNQYVPKVRRLRELLVRHKGLAMRRFVADIRRTICETGIPFIVIACGRGGTALGQIIAVRISTELLSPAQMGGVTQLGSITNIFSLLLVVPVCHYVNRGFLEWNDSGRLQGYLKHYLRYILCMAFFALVVAYGVQVIWKLVSGFSATAVALLTGLYMLASPISSLGATGLNLLNQRVKFAAYSNLPVWVALGASPLLFILHSSPAFWSLGQITGPAVASISFWVLWRHLRGSPADISFSAHRKTLPFRIPAIFRFAWPVMLLAVLWWIQSQSYKFIVDRIQGTTEVGFFAVGYSLAAAPIALYEGLFGQFYEPIFYNELKGQDTKGQASAWNNYADLYLPGLMIVGTFVAFGAPFLAKVLLGEVFRPAAIQIASWAAIIETMRAAGSMMYHLGMAKVDNRMTIIPVAIGAALSLLCVYIFGQYEPFLGTLAGLFIAGLAVIIITIIMSRRVLPITWPIRRIMTGLLLSIPLAIFFQIMHWIILSPGFILSLFILALGAVYVIVVQTWMFTGRARY